MDEKKINNQEDLNNIKELQTKIDNNEKSKKRGILFLTIIFVIVFFAFVFSTSDYDEKNKTDSMSWAMLFVMPVLVAIYIIVVRMVSAKFNLTQKKYQNEKRQMSKKYFSEETKKEVDKYKNKIKILNIVAGIIAGVILFASVLLSVITSTSPMPFIITGFLIFIIIYIFISSRKNKYRIRINKIEENLID